MTVHISIPLDEDQAAQLDAIATARSATTVDIVAEAVATYLDYDAWFVREVEKGLESARKGELLDHEEVVARLQARMDDATKG